MLGYGPLSGSAPLGALLTPYSAVLVAPEAGTIRNVNAQTLRVVSNCRSMYAVKAPDDISSEADHSHFDACFATVALRLLWAKDAPSGSVPEMA